MELLTYREYIHRECSETDMSNEKEATALCQFLAAEAVELNEVNLKFEEKLKEVMSAKDFEEFSKSLAKDVAKKWLENLPEGDFRDFAMANMDILMDDELSVEEAVEAINEREES